MSIPARAISQETPAAAFKDCLGEITEYFQSCPYATGTQWDDMNAVAFHANSCPNCSERVRRHRESRKRFFS
jgi:hypothetical protein